MSAPAAFGLGRLPRVAFGPGSFATVPDVVARHGRRVLLVTGGASLAASGRRAELLAGLAAAGVTVAGEVRATGEPSPEHVDNAVVAHRDAGVDVVLAVGGGSALDLGKAVAGLLRTGGSILDHLEGVGAQVPYPGPAVPLVAVPTTAGTGSEATRNAVISRRGPDGWKRSFRDEALVAADAIVDPDLLAGAPPDVIAANGMDALTQLLESYTSLRAGPLTDALARNGLASIGAGLVAWHADPDGPGAADARAHVAYAALLSGICLAHAGLGAVHGLAAPLGARLPIPHGAACGATLAATTAANIAALERQDPAADALGRYAAAGRILSRLPETTPDEAARRMLLVTLRDWTRTLAISGLGAFGLDAAGIPAIVADARDNSMRTNPIVLTDAALGDVLLASLERA